nr:tigger transposable element-derived protein 6 [Parasteatoda tepidariorum]
MAGRKQLSFQDKLNVIKDIDDGMKQIDAARKYGLSQSTVATFLKKRKQIEDTVSSNLINPKRKRLKVATNENIDAAVLKWFQEMRATNIPINGPLLCTQARKFAVMLGNETFKASNGWLMRFRDRHGITFQEVHGEKKSAPINEANEWKQEKMTDILQKYKPENVYNADEAGLFFQLLPDRTLAFKGEKCYGGKKSKQRLTVLLCANSTGTHKIQPLVIGKSLKPRCFKNVKSLPVEYKANKKAWMTSKFFSEWLLMLDKEMKKRKKKIALLIDNCTAHTSIPKLHNVGIVYFPANCTSILQPLDMGIIKCFKGYYRKRLVESILVNIENKVEDPFKTVNVKEACDIIAGSWWEVTEKTIQNCWKKVGLCVLEDEIVSNSEENSTDSDLSDNQEFVLNLQKSLSQLEEKMGKTYGVNVEDYLTADDDLTIFAGVSEEENLSEITDEMENNDEEEDGDDEPSVSPSVLSPHEDLQSVKSLKTFFSSLPFTNENHFRALDSMHTLLVDLTVRKMNKQTKISDFFQ